MDINRNSRSNIQNQNAPQPEGRSSQQDPGVFGRFKVRASHILNQAWSTARAMSYANSPLDINNASLKELKDRAIHYPESFEHLSKKDHDHLQKTLTQCLDLENKEDHLDDMLSAAHLLLGIDALSDLKKTTLKKLTFALFDVLHNSNKELRESAKELLLLIAIKKNAPFDYLAEKCIEDLKSPNQENRRTAYDIFSSLAQNDRAPLDNLFSKCSSLLKSPDPEIRRLSNELALSLSEKDPTLLDRLFSHILNKLESPDPELQKIAQECFLDILNKDIPLDKIKNLFPKIETLVFFHSPNPERSTLAKEIFFKILDKYNLPLNDTIIALTDALASPDEIVSANAYKLLPILLEQYSNIDPESLLEYSLTKSIQKNFYNRKEREATSEVFFRLLFQYPALLNKQDPRKILLVADYWLDSNDPEKIKKTETILLQSFLHARLKLTDLFDVFPTLQKIVDSPYLSPPLKEKAIHFQTDFLNGLKNQSFVNEYRIKISDCLSEWAGNIQEDHPLYDQILPNLLNKLGINKFLKIIHGLIDQDKPNSIHNANTFLIDLYQKFENDPIDLFEHFRFINEILDSPNASSALKEKTNNFLDESLSILEEQKEIDLLFAYLSSLQSILNAPWASDHSKKAVISLQDKFLTEIESNNEFVRAYSSRIIYRLIDWSKSIPESHPFYDRLLDACFKAIEFQGIEGYQIISQKLDELVSSSDPKTIQSANIFLNHFFTTLKINSEKILFTILQHNPEQILSVWDKIKNIFVHPNLSDTVKEKKTDLQEVLLNFLEDPNFLMKHQEKIFSLVTEWVNKISEEHPFYERVLMASLNIQALRFDLHPELIESSKDLSKYLDLINKVLVFENASSSLKEKINNFLDKRLSVLDQQKDIKQLFAYLPSLQAILNTPWTSDHSKKTVTSLQDKFLTEIESNNEFLDDHSGHIINLIIDWSKSISESHPFYDRLLNACFKVIESKRVEDNQIISKRLYELISSSNSNTIKIGNVFLNHFFTILKDHPEEILSIWDKIEKISTHPNLSDAVKEKKIELQEALLSLLEDPNFVMAHQQQVFNFASEWIRQIHEGDPLYQSVLVAFLNIQALLAGAQNSSFKIYAGLAKKTKEANKIDIQPLIESTRLPSLDDPSKTDSFYLNASYLHTQMPIPDKMPEASPKDFDDLIDKIVVWSNSFSEKQWEELGFNVSKKTAIESLRDAIKFNSPLYSLLNATTYSKHAYRTKAVIAFHREKSKEDPSYILATCHEFLNCVTCASGVIAGIDVAFNQNAALEDPTDTKALSAPIPNRALKLALTDRSTLSVEEANQSRFELQMILAKKTNKWEEIRKESDRTGIRLMSLIDTYIPEENLSALSQELELISGYIFNSIKKRQELTLDGDGKLMHQLLRLPEGSITSQPSHQSQYVQSAIGGAIGLNPKDRPPRYDRSGGVIDLNLRNTSASSFLHTFFEEYTTQSEIKFLSNQIFDFLQSNDPKDQALSRALLSAINLSLFDEDLEKNKMQKTTNNCFIVRSSHSENNPDQSIDHYIPITAEALESLKALSNQLGEGAFYDLVDDMDPNNEANWPPEAQKTQRQLASIGLKIQDFGNLNTLEEYFPAAAAFSKLFYDLGLIIPAK